MVLSNNRVGGRTGTIIPVHHLRSVAKVKTYQRSVGSPYTMAISNLRERWELAPQAATHLGHNDLTGSRTKSPNSSPHQTRAPWTLSLLFIGGQFWPFVTAFFNSALRNFITALDPHLREFCIFNGKPGTTPPWESKSTELEHLLYFGPA